MKHPSAAAEPRRHHYVPKFLIKGFATERKRGKFQTQVFDKRTDGRFTASIEDVMVEGDFNALDVDGDRVSLEGYIGRFEAAAAPLVERIVREGSVATLSEAERLEIARFVALQFIRGTGHRAQFDDAARAIATEIERRGMPIGTSLDMNSDQVKAHSLLAIMQSLPEYASYMSVKDMLLFRAPTGTEFLLGDNPVTLKNEEQTGFWGTLGLACRGIQIYLPLSAEYSLALWCPTIREGFMGKLKTAKSQMGTMKARAVLGARPVPIPPALVQQYDEALAQLAPFQRVFEEGETGSMSKDNVTHLNSLQVMHAERFVVSKGGQFDVVLEMLANDDRFRHGRRMKVS